jgi:hypothetical protein
MFKTNLTPLGFSTACASISAIKSKSDRMGKALKQIKLLLEDVQNLSDLELAIKVLLQEQKIYEQDRIMQIQEIQLIVCKMEAGLVNRRKFMKENGIEEKYQGGKKVNVIDLIDKQTKKD